jgi:uncharacterized protein (DUF2384 family)
LAAYAWMTMRHAVLGGTTATELLQTPGGTEEVQRALARIKHGVFA